MATPLPTPHESVSASVAREEYICWSRMQAEAGQGLAAIVARKECEREAGNGHFFWGVGNAPAVMISALARLKCPVGAVFSIMKGKPKTEDISPRRTLVWRKYLDVTGVERELPPNALITSRAEIKVSYQEETLCFDVFLQHSTPNNTRNGLRSPCLPKCRRHRRGRWRVTSNGLTSQDRTARTNFRL